MRNPKVNLTDKWQELLKEIPTAHHKALEYLAKDQGGRWLQVIQQGEVEYGLSVKLGNKLVQGQIDLWGQDQSGQFWVVDYKTGSPKYQDKAFEQLMIYTWALQKMKKLDSNKEIQLSVIYPFSNLTVTRPAPSATELQVLVEKDLQGLTP